MKKFAIFAAIGAVALAMTSCDLLGKMKGGDEGEIDAVYEAETFDIDDEDNIVDPNDAEAYAKYAYTGDDEEESEPAGSSQVIDETEPDIPTGPSDVDMVNVNITEPHQVDWLLDEFDYDINHLREILKDQSDIADIQSTLNHITMVAEKMMDLDGTGIITPAQEKRFLKQCAAFQEIKEKYTK